MIFIYGSSFLLISFHPPVSSSPNFLGYIESYVFPSLFLLKNMLRAYILEAYTMIRSFWRLFQASSHATGGSLLSRFAILLSCFKMFLNPFSIHFKLSIFKIFLNTFCINKIEYTTYSCFRILAIGILRNYIRCAYLY